MQPLSPFILATIPTSVPILNLPNEALAEHLKEIAYFYTLENDTYRHKVFNEAAQKIEIYPDEIISGADAKSKIQHGIGPSIMEVIDEYITTGESSRLQSLKNKNEERSKTIDLFMSLHGVGIVTATKFYDQGFRTLDELWYKANLTKAQKLSIFYREHLKLRIPRAEMDRINQRFRELLPNLELVMVGSYRRGESTSGDIDILIKQKQTVQLPEIVDTLRKSGLIKEDFSQGDSRYLGLLQLYTNPVRRLDILLIPSDSWGSALLHSTGSKRFNILIRKRAIELNFRLNEYGLYTMDQMKVSTPTEESIFEKLKIRYLTPQERTQDLASLTVM